jgi:hypothetical protein
MGCSLTGGERVSTRHGGTVFGQEGSGFQTKVAVAVLYERWPGVPG